MTHPISKIFAGLIGFMGAVSLACTLGGASPTSAPPPTAAISATAVPTVPPTAAVSAAGGGECANAYFPVADGDRWTYASDTTDTAGASIRAYTYETTDKAVSDKVFTSDSVASTGIDVTLKWNCQGGNLAVLCSMLGTPHGPDARLDKGGVLFLEDVNEHPYRVERALLQLHQAGVLARQKAVLLGHFSNWKPSPLDRGYTLKSTVSHLRSVCSVPILTGLPFGHVHPKVSLPVGARVQLVVQGRDVLVGW